MTATHDIEEEKHKRSRHAVAPDVQTALKKMGKKKRQELLQLATPRIVEPYTKHIPHPTQQVFLSLKDKEVFFGGSAGGGKSDALLMAALQYVDVPGYSALILRRTWPDLNSPGAILDRTKDWLRDTPATMREGGRRWTFPSGAKLTFGTMLFDKDKYRYQSSEYQFVGFDELTHFPEPSYLYLFSRIRKPTLVCLTCSRALNVQRDVFGELKYYHGGKHPCKNPFPDPKVLDQYPASATGMTIFDVPLRMRSASNPGGYGHQWVKDRFVDPLKKEPGAIFVPSSLKDNPSLDYQSYVENLQHLSPVDRERLLAGDWDVTEQGNMFLRHEFLPIDDIKRKKIVERCRYWDLAATVTDKSDWTAGALLAKTHDNQWIIEDIVRFQGHPKDVEDTIAKVARYDGQNVIIRMEQEPGSAGVNVIAHFKRNVLQGYMFDGIRSSGSKESRAGAFATQVKGGNVYILTGAWNRDFIDEASVFPIGQHDDQVDAVVGAFNALVFGHRSRLIV